MFFIKNIGSYFPKLPGRSKFLSLSLSISKVFLTVTVVDSKVVTQRKRKDLDNQIFLTTEVEGGIEIFFVDLMEEVFQNDRIFLS